MLESPTHTFSPPRGRARRSGLVVAVCVAGIVRAAAATASAEWSAPTLVFETTDEIVAPAMAVDPTDRVYVAWSVDAGHDPQRQYIYAARRDGPLWSRPRRLITDPSANAPSLAIDPYAELHLIWSGTMSRLRYRRWVAEDATWADRAHGAMLAEGNANAQIWADPHGRLHVIYAGSNTTGVMYRASDDGGGTWTAPVRVAGPSARNASADYARLALSTGGVLHAAWTELELPDLERALGVFYARSTDGGATWSPAVPMAGPGFGQINVAAGAKNDTIHVAWNGMAGTEGRYHRWSSDGGTTWSPTQQIVARGGSDAPPQLVIDSTGALHLITAYDAAVWHAVWDGARWSELECVACGTPASPVAAGEPSAVVADGNTLHVVYWQEQHHQLWHTMAHLAAPRVAPPPVQTVGWWSERFWHRDAQRAPALLGILASIALVRVLRRRLARRERGASALR